MTLEDAPVLEDKVLSSLFPPINFQGTHGGNEHVSRQHLQQEQGGRSEADEGKGAVISGQGVDGDDGFIVVLGGEGCH